MRIGINTGEVIAVTDPRPGEAMATGDAVNAAARLEQAASPAQVLVAERTAQAARGFRFGAPQVLELRGRAEPLRALELLAEQPVTEGTLSGSAAARGPGRELELLTTTYGRVVEEGRPHLVTLYGEAGVGKSRLVGELLAGLEACRPRPIVRGRCLAYGDGISYWPLAELLKAYAQALDTRHGRRRACAGSPSGRGRPRGRRRRCARRSRRPHGEHRPRARPITRAQPQELRAETHFAWRSFFSALAAEAPTVVIVEDVHWADTAVLELLEDVASHAAGPLLVLCTARPELTTRRPTWGGGGCSFTGLVVEPLDGGRERGARGAPARADGRRADAGIIARAEGNPFFLEEIVRTREPARAARRASRTPCRRRSRRASTCCRATRSARCRRPQSSAACSGRGPWPRLPRSRPAPSTWCSTACRNAISSSAGCRRR